MGPQLVNRFDAAAVRAGALTDLAILVPCVALYALLRAAGVLGSDTGLIVTAVVATGVAPLAGGYTAGRRQLAAPLTNGAAAAALAAVAYVAFRIADGVVQGRYVHPATVAILTMVSTTLGVAGGYAAFRSSRP